MATQNVVVDLSSSALLAGLPSDTTPVPSIRLSLLLASPVSAAPSPSIDSPPTQHSILNADGTVADENALAIKFTKIFASLKVAPEQASLTLVVSIWTPPPTRQQLCRLAFERLRVNLLFLADAPLMAALGAGQANCLVIDVGFWWTEVTAVVDFMPHLAYAERIPFGRCHLRLPSSYTIEMVDGEIKNALFEEGRLHEAIWSVIKRTEGDKRRALLDSVILTGPYSALSPSTFRSLCLWIDLRATLAAHMQPLLAGSEYAGEQQPVSIRFRSVPDFYTDMLSSLNLTSHSPCADNDTEHPAENAVLEGIKAVEPKIAWFGAMLAGKSVFGDSKSCYRRDDWLARGPAIMHNET